MQDAQKAAWSIPYVSVAFFPRLKQNSIAYRSFKVSVCIFEIHQQWQSGFCRVHSNYCCSCSFEAEIIKVGQSSYKIYSNNIQNLKESTTILNVYTRCLETYRVHLVCLFGESNVGQYFGNGSHKSMLLPRSWRWRYILDCETPSSPDTLRTLHARYTFISSESFFQTLCDHWGSCNPSEISSTIWLLYCDQLRHHILHNKCFLLLPQHHGLIRTC